MQSLSGLIVRLERAQRPDRRLDAEIVAAVLGPPGALLDPTCYPDGYDIETAPDANGENVTWREADDVGRITSSLEDACLMTQPRFVAG